MTYKTINIKIHKDCDLFTTPKKINVNTKFVIVGGAFYW